MCQEEGGYYAIKGFLYQYDKAILEILSRDERVPVYIERIQDIDCENYVLQVKHKEAADYSASKMREPIIKLLDTFVNDMSKKFCLYAYFRNQKPHSIKFKTVQELKDILKYRDKEKTENLQGKYTNEQMESFIKNFTLQFAENYEIQFENVLKMIREKMKVEEEEAWIYHAIICDKLFKVALESEDDKRCITYEEINKYVDKCKTITFESKYRNIIGRDKFLKTIKRKYFTFNKPNINRFERLFMIECNEIEDGTIVRYIIDALKTKYYRAGKSPAPYICFRGLNKKVLNEVKIGMVDDEQAFSDGTYFDGDIFRSDKLVNDTNVTIKFVSEENVENLKVKFKEVYDFYLSSQTTIFEDIYKIKIQVENLDEIKVLIS